MAARRSYGSGRIAVRTDKQGVETFYGVWRSNGRQLKRRLGVKRTASGEGLAKRDAEKMLRRLMDEVVPTAAAGDRLTLSQVGQRYRAYLETQGRKRATLIAVESTFRVWLDPQLGDRAIDAITPEDVEDLMRAMTAAGVGAKSVRNYLGTLSATFRFAQHPRREWAIKNPVEAIDLPPVEARTEIQYLKVTEVEALASAAVDGEHQALDRALYLTGAMTGLRQGELIALRWSDVDWSAQRIRVRRSHVLGQFDTPKSRRSVRSVPMSMRLAGELDAWQQATAWGGDDELVFAEPSSGEVLRRGALMRRYRRALKAAQLDPARRFHDLRHTFGTTMAAGRVPMRTLQEWMGHRNLATTEIYADYAPNANEVAMVDQAFADSPESHSWSHLERA
ncbi:MAG TPA: site-specific integrase [Solirubrobacteraceae bacterium]|nr:site-specific integrase [Solirubrobacteraceae bacterium]